MAPSRINPSRVLLRYLAVLILLSLIALAVHWILDALGLPGAPYPECDNTNQYGHLLDC